MQVLARRYTGVPGQLYQLYSKRESTRGSRVDLDVQVVRWLKATAEARTLFAAASRGSTYVCHCPVLSCSY